MLTRAQLSILFHPHEFVVVAFSLLGCRASGGRPELCAAASFRQAAGGERRVMEEVENKREVGGTVYTQSPPKVSEAIPFRKARFVNVNAAYCAINI